ncbi:utp20, partial [Symbiodinium sp. CCMP2456]
MLATSTRFQSFGQEEAAVTKPEVKAKEEKQGSKEARRAMIEKSTVFEALMSHIQNALETPALQSAALQLLRRVLLRNRVLNAAVYECIDAIGDIMITGSDKRTAQQCAQIFVDFMLDYPHEHKAMQLRITHLLKNLGYAEEGGRRAALNCLYLVVLHFPEVELSTKWGSLIFAATAARLPQ